MRSRFGRAAITGLLGTALISLAASLPGSPFAFKVAGAWFFGVPSPAATGIATATGGALLAALACGFGGIVLLCRSWLVLTRSVMHSVMHTPPTSPRRLA